MVDGIGGVVPDFPRNLVYLRTNIPIMLGNNKDETALFSKFFSRPKKRKGDGHLISRSEGTRLSHRAPLLRPCAVRFSAPARRGKRHRFRRSQLRSVFIENVGMQETQSAQRTHIPGVPEVTIHFEI